MWSLADEQELLVHADALMHVGHEHGEKMARELSARIAGRQGGESTPCVDAELADYLEQHPQIEPTLEAGVMVAAKLWPRQYIAPARLLEMAEGLLRLEASRWLRHLHIAAQRGEDDWALLPLLRATGLRARPRVIVIGPYPNRIRCAATLEHIGGVGELGELARGLHTLIVPGFRQSYRWQSTQYGRVVELPWADAGLDKHERRDALAQLHEQAKSGGRLSSADFTRCMRALWDPSRRVRNLALAGLSLFGRLAAQVLPELLLPGKIQGCAISIAPEVTRRLREDRELLETIAANFGVEQLHAAKWALYSPRALVLARARAQAFDDSSARKWARKLEPPRSININQAGAQELQEIPGIGPVYASRILAARLRRPFESIEELREIPGVGPRNYARMTEWLSVGPPSVREGLAS